MEDKNKIFSYVGMGAGALMLISVFLPFLSGMGTSLSLWSIPAPSRFLFIFLGLAVAALFVLNKKTELTYLAAGYGFFSSFQFIIAYEGLSDFSIGFYLMLLASISMFVAAYLYDESKGVALLDLSNIKIGANNGQAQPVQPQVQPVQPQVQPVQPQVQPVQPQVQPVQPQNDFTNQNGNQAM